MCVYFTTMGVYYIEKCISYNINQNLNKVFCSNNIKKIQTYIVVYSLKMNTDNSDLDSFLMKYPNAMTEYKERIEAIHDHYERILKYKQDLLAVHLDAVNAVLEVLKQQCCNHTES